MREEAMLVLSAGIVLFMIGVLAYTLRAEEEKEGKVEISLDVQRL